MTDTTTVSPVLGDYAVAGPPQGQWTVDDWETLPDDGNRYEIIQGVLHMTTAPSNFHQWICNAFVRHLGIPAQDQGIAYWFTAPSGVILSNEDAVQPDFLLVRTANGDKIQRRTMGAPDLVVEVRSPGNSTEEMREKQAAYARAGVPEYAVVEPRTRTVQYSRLDAPGRYAAAQTYGEGDTLTFDCAPGIPLAVAALFAGAPNTEL